MAEILTNNEISLKSSKKAFSSVVHTLAMPNFFTLPKSKKRRLKDSPVFEFVNATWCFPFYPNGRPRDVNKKFFDVSIVRLTTEIPLHKIFYTITLLDAKGEKYDEFYNVDVFDKDNGEHGVAHFFEKYHHKQNSFPLNVNTLELRCELFCGEYKINDVSLIQKSPLEDKDIETLRQDLKKLFLNGENADFILKTADKEFPVHRHILMARSDVFEAMMKHDMVEKNSGFIHVPDCDSEAMEQFLYYVYSGKVEALNQDNVLELYYIANKYNVVLLKEQCSTFIKESLTPPKVTDVIQFALHHDDNRLLEGATEYFISHMSDILPTVEWMTFMKSNMIAANELLIKTTKK